LGQPIMVTHIDKNQAAMITLAMYPAGNPSGVASIFSAKRATGMGTIGVHG
jgi:hypothetical protein